MCVAQENVEQWKKDVLVTRKHNTGHIMPVNQKQRNVQYVRIRVLISHQLTPST